MSSDQRVVGISGFSGAGKTTLLRALLQECGAYAVSTGDYIRAEAAKRHMEPTRQNLQWLGQLLIETLEPSDFVSALLTGTSSADLLIIEGIRHVAIWRELEKRFSKSLLVYLSVDVSVRIQRIVERDGLTPDAAERVICHPVESEVSRLEALADIVVPVTVPAEVSASVLAELRRLSFC